MYIKTPKRYSRTSRRSIFPFKRILFSGFLIFLIIIGVGLYQNRDLLTPIVGDFASTAIAAVEEQASTLTAPTPMPTRNPVNDIQQANAYWSSGAVGDAMSLYVSALPSLPNNVDVHYRTTLGYIIQGNIDAAVTSAENTVTANPFSSDAWAIRASALDWAGRYGEAIASALHARELDPQNPRALAYLAQAYFSVGQTQRAMSTVDQALDLDPDSIEALRTRGVINRLGNFDLEAALNDFQIAFEAAQQLDPPAANLIAIDIAQIALGQRDYALAISTLETVLESNPQNTRALYWIGNIQRTGNGDNSQAACYLLRCLEYDPENVSCSYELGRAQWGSDQQTLAAQSFENAIAFGSLNAQHYWWAANAQISLGNCPRAATFLTEGYALAQQRGESWLMDDFNAIMPLCNIMPEADPLPSDEIAPLDGFEDGFEGDQPGDPDPNAEPSTDPASSA